MTEIRLKRAYEKPAPDDGLRVLVERLWPRGLSKERASVDLWMKDVAPSPELRRWFNHDPAKWNEFQTRYRAELRQKNRRGRGTPSEMPRRDCYLRLCRAR